MPHANETDDGTGERETFHIYILSFVYGLMMVGWLSLYNLTASIISYTCRSIESHKNDVALGRFILN